MLETGASPAEVSAPALHRHATTFGRRLTDFHLRNIPNHPFLWDFKAFWNSSFTKLGSLA